MKLKYSLTALLSTVVTSEAVNILTPGDSIFAIGVIESQSNYPGGEAPAALIDNNAQTKYLNFGKDRSGFIVTPGSSTPQSIVFTTGGDAEERDPSSFSIWGTNDAITSADNSTGSSEIWNPIANGVALNLPSERGLTSTAVDFTNNTAYSSYRVSFDTLKNTGGAAAMQVAEIQLFSGLGGTGSSILGSTNPIIGFDFDTGPSSGHPDNEGPAQAIDGNTASKYLNFGGDNTGFIVTPSVGISIIESFTITTANDAPGRDPAAYSLWGYNGAISSSSNSGGDSEAWSQIQSGIITPPGGFETDYAIEEIIGNNTAYAHYRFDVTSTSGDALMQFSEIQFDGQIVPEPSSVVLSLFVSLGLLRRKR